MKKLLSLFICGVLALSLTACSGGVSQEEYNKVVSERDSLKAQLEQSKSDSSNVHSASASNNVWKPGDTPQENNANNPNLFDADAVISQLKVTEYTWKNSIDTYYIALAVKNASPVDLEISTNMQFYDSSDKIIGAKEQTQDAVAAGSETIFIFNNDEAFSKYTYEFTVSEPKYYACVSQNITYEESLTDKKAIITAKNNGDKPVEFAQCYVIFMNGKDAVGYESRYCTDNDSELKPGKTQSVELKCYEPFDSVKVYFTGRGDK